MKRYLSIIDICRHDFLFIFTVNDRNQTNNNLHKYYKVVSVYEIFCMCCAEKSLRMNVIMSRMKLCPLE